MLSITPPSWRKAVALFLLGILSVTSGTLALFSGSDALLVAVLLFGGAALVLWVTDRRERSRLPSRRLAAWGLGLALAGLGLGFVVLPFLFVAVEATAKASTEVDLKGITFAFQDYARTHDGQLPPAASHAPDGRPLLSWRVLLLPFLDEEKLYKQFRLDEAWDSPHNVALLPCRPRIYAPRSGRWPCGRRSDPSSTFYQVFVGKKTAFEGSVGLRLEGDLLGGASKTVLVVEAGEAVPWTKPADLSYDPDRPLPPLGGVFTGEGPFNSFGYRWRSGFHVGFGDGTERFFPADGGQAELHKLLTRP
jgi:hypothetical protein